MIEYKGKKYVCSEFHEIIRCDSGKICYHATIIKTIHPPEVETIMFVYDLLHENDYSFEEAKNQHKDLLLFRCLEKGYIAHN